MRNVVILGANPAIVGDEGTYVVPADCRVRAVSGSIGGFAVVSTVPLFDVAALAAATNATYDDLIAILTGNAASPGWARVDGLDYPLTRGDIVRVITDGNVAYVNLQLDDSPI